MINRSEILQTIAMIDQQHLDIRTITMGISLLDCADTDIERSCTKVYDKICRLAGDLVRTGEDIEAEFGIPIVNKRISVTPIAEICAAVPDTVTVSHWANSLCAPAAVMRQYSSGTAVQLPEDALYSSSVLVLAHGCSSSSTFKKSCPSAGFSGSSLP